MSAIKYLLTIYIDDSEKSDFSYSTDVPFLSFHVGDEFIPDAAYIDAIERKFIIKAIRHRVWETNGQVTHAIELDTSSSPAK